MLKRKALLNKTDATLFYLNDIAFNGTQKEQLIAMIETFLLAACKFSCPLQESPSEEMGKNKRKSNSIEQ